MRGGARLEGEGSSMDVLGLLTSPFYPTPGSSRALRDLAGAGALHSGARGGHLAALRHDTPHRGLVDAALDGPPGRSLALLALLGSGDPSDPRPKRCSLGYYHSLDPKALAAVKTFRDSYEQEMLSWGKRNCSFSRRKEPRKVSPCTRLHLAALALENTESVLRNLSRPALATRAVPVLELLSAVRRNVVACMTPPSLGSLPKPSASLSMLGYGHSGPRPGRPRELSRLAEPRRSEGHPPTQPRTRDPEREDPGEGKWAQPPDFDIQVSPSRGKLEGVDQSSKSRRKYLQERRMTKAKSLESPQCREAETILSLLKLLTFDLKLVILSGSCA
ncbi:uncharacterized protein LOC114038139 [Vombatus ursinus]|uniref:uncharacterized protein LOC114038139 n=1 Tax=Vombatus ursinus TaxID=29139 RepID=UPI000FFD29F5|nr:uncharacterized protein LOC114038139 [Vombatus ursinus]